FDIGRQSWRPGDPGAFPFRLNRNGGSTSLFDAFSSPERGSTPHQVRGRLSPENALTVKYHFRDCGRRFDEFERAILGRQLEQARRFRLVLLEQCEFAAVKIGFAGLLRLLLRILVSGGGNRLGGAQFAAELPDNRRRPRS